jgi:hypothetical protein
MERNEVPTRGDGTPGSLAENLVPEYCSACFLNLGIMISEGVSFDAGTVIKCIRCGNEMPVQPFRI